MNSRSMVDDTTMRASHGVDVLVRIPVDEDSLRHAAHHCLGFVTESMSWSHTFSSASHLL